MQKKLIACFFSLVLAGSLGFFVLFAQITSEPKLAPLNPAFLESMDDLRNGRSYQGLHGLGAIPSPVDLSHLKGVQDNIVRAGYAASYDLRNYNKVTSVKNQGSCGDCWAFGAFGSLESSLLPGENRDFAEIDLARNHGFDWTECAGGNTNMSEAYLARWAGPYNETDYPYPYSASISAGTASVQKHVQTVMWLPARASSTDNDTIKWFLTNYGAITFALYWDDSYFDSTDNSYYFPTAHYVDHEICFIGWDDNFDKSKFANMPAGNGAFLCKNGWGTSWGDGGYFWLSYYDPTITDMAVFTDAESVTNYKYIYQYDPLGVTNGFGYNALICWGANVFTASTSDPLNAFGFIINDSCSITYSIYKNPTAGNPTSGTLMSSGTIGTYSYAGYYTYVLPTPVSLNSGDRFSIVIKYANSSYIYPLPIEGYVSGYSSAAANAVGQSYYSSNGSSWTDFTNYNSNSYRFNCTIKAFTGAAIPAISALTPLPAPPQAVGTPITWTATVSGGVAPLQYKFWLYSGGVWAVAQDYSTLNTWTWTPTQAGQYAVQVWVRNAGSITNYDTWKGSGYFNITGSTLSLSSLTPSPAPPQGIGTPITWTATASGGIAPLQYKFYLYNVSTGWTILQDYSSLNTWTWTPTQAGQYAVQVWVRNAGSTANYDAWKGSGYFNITGSTLSLSSLTPSPAPPQSVGTPITWTATASGGIAPLQYKFYLYNASTGWTIPQDYSTSKTWTWTSTQPGQYAVQVWVRNSGSTANYDAWKGSGYFNISGTSLSVTSLTPTPGLPQSVGTPITWTAIATNGIAPLQYKFYLYSTTSGWVIAQDFSTSNTWIWTPSQAGQYAVQVWVRNAGSTANYDSWKGSGYFNIAAPSANLMLLRY